MDGSAAPEFTLWHGTVKPTTVGDVTVTPPWFAGESASLHTVVIDPAMAFGTGEHATTRLMLELLQRTVRSGDFVCDLGAGSAVLAIAAAKLGAARVAAIELDPLAISNAEENVVANGVAGVVTVIEGDAAMLLPLLAPVNLLLANILSSVIIELLPVMRAALAPDGSAVISGIMTSERDTVAKALESGGWRIIQEETSEEWWSSAVAPR